MTEPIKTISAECRIVNHALRALGKSELRPPQITDSVAGWRKIALLTMGGQVNGAEVTRADILQASGQITGQLFSTVKRDNSGRPITKFHGNAGTCWEPFLSPARRLSAINTRGPKNV